MPMTSPPVHTSSLEYVDSVARFLELQAEWDGLEARCVGHIFQNFRFLRSWLETAGQHTEIRPAVVLYREDGILRAIFPGCTIKRAGVPTLTWLGGFHIVDFGDILFDQSAELPIDDFLKSVFKLLKKKIGFHICLLHNVRDDAQIHGYLVRNFRPYRSNVAPFIQLDGGFQQYFDTLKTFRKKMKSDTLRQIRRLSDLGTLKFQVYEHGDHAPDSIVRILIDQKRTRLEELGQSGVVGMPGYDDMLLTEARFNNYVHISCLSLNGDVIAAHFGYRYKNNRLYYYMPSFAAEHSSYSPGRILIFHLLNYCFEQGIEIFDFTIGDESYKYDWTREEALVTNFMDTSFTTRLARYALAIRDPKSLVERLRVRRQQSP